MIHELETVVLTVDLPNYRLRAGDVGTVVHSQESKGYLVEFVTMAGETLGVVDLRPDQVRRPEGPSISHARSLI